MGDNNNELPVAVVALVVAVVALAVALLQITQAILASARGLPNCDERVIGKWAESTQRIFKPSQLRVEVLFQAPVIFIAPYDNKNGPVKDAPVKYGPVMTWNGPPKNGAVANGAARDGAVKEGSAKSQLPLTMEGTPDSCAECRVSWDEVMGVKTAPSPNAKERVHTVENEKATWVTLLVAIQKMERESKNWETGQHGEANKLALPPQNGTSTHIGSTTTLPKLQEEPTLAIQMQIKQRSFETNPAIKKPYATTTISHLVQLAAILGLYWKVFDPDDNKYRAAGNGYSLMGYRVTDFGIVFTFENTGSTVNKARRVIPTSEVKELCFGRVPTLYRERGTETITRDGRIFTRIKLEDNEWQDPLYISSKTGPKLEILQLGSEDEIVETLTQIGCNVNTTTYAKTSGRNKHLFPVTFEVIGMLARTLHITDRCFRFLPNPTIFPWDGDSLSLSRLLEAYSALLEEHHKEMTSHKLENVEDGARSDIERIKQLVDCSTELGANVGQGRHLTYLQLNHLHMAIDVADEIIKDGETPWDNQKVVMDVLRCHLQEVLGAINNNPGTSSYREKSPSFHDLLELPPEKRERSFMRTYFEKILWSVIRLSTDRVGKVEQEQVSRQIHKETENRQSLHVYAPVAIRVGDSAPSSSPSSPADSPTTPPAIHRSLTPTPGLLHSRNYSSGEGASKKKGEEKPSWEKTLQSRAEMQRVKIWYALVFRMICWLMLHDFDKKDIQVPSSDLMGNRQPVFIT
ncbi:modin [Colletotrichum plurivorum]|uniref:Modin n=1 Tax=Colletotrichum plurivorum TaxID=2175906 RepID=A0A8H6JN23_9PEZI|nr:modin [Colletotrichum plurivorum]